MLLTPCHLQYLWSGSYRNQAIEGEIVTGTWFLFSFAFLMLFHLISKSLLKLGPPSWNRGKRMRSRLKARCGCLLYVVQIWLDFAEAWGLGKGWQGASFFQVKLLTSWSWQDSWSISEYMKNWEEVVKCFLCAVLNGELSFERFELNIEHIETNLLPSCLKGIWLH